MSKKIIINPITRISGLLSIEVEIENHKIIDARSTGNMFRGFEMMLKGRPPKDATYITERICGICSTAHSYVSTLAVEKAIQIEESENSKAIRDLVHGCDLIQSHTRHFYLFVLPDYISGDWGMPSFRETLADSRIPKAIADKIFSHYVESLEISRKAHDLLAMLSGKAPHNHGIFPGGVTLVLTEPKRVVFKEILQDILNFAREKMYEDTFMISKYYDDYYDKGYTGENFLTFGMINGYSNKELNYVDPAVMLDGKIEPIDFSMIYENIKSSWFRAIDPGQNQDVMNLSDTAWIDDINKQGGYSFIKASRYREQPMEVGPLARMKLGGYYQGKSSVIGRIVARTNEVIQVCELMMKLIDRVKINEKSFISKDVPEKGEGIAFKDTMRGALCHYVSIRNSVIDKYNIITPSTWNLGPSIPGGEKGIVERALINTHIENEDHPIEIGRVVRSFDPCISCATHVFKYKEKIMEVIF
ncbi:Ni/Fe hydrogenase [Clostridium polyendosporum]|uniref:Ni/Fe hydrogenase n=1 Tax=Clostridium polyendosporum TaxID=69208 RepID=A0A919RYY4_9CLOT|nr:nickel-dependent hydrogenase large subunit [Clostridium polyendosporum]GIM29052.1 Ni/Fe hydrogenase [Clostridium polyendosporum]